MKEMICRLCLQTIGNNDCQPVEESVLKFLKLNINISKENVMCVECANGLRVFSNNFTPGCAYTEDETTTLSDLGNGVKLDTEPIETTSNPESHMKTEIKCSFCTKTHGREDLISLQISKEHKFLLEQYISKTNLKNTKELLTCESCLGSVEGILSVILRCLEVEEKISKYIELEGTDDKGQVELNKVQQFTFRTVIKSEIESFGVSELEGRSDQVQEECTGMAEAKIKYEKGISNTELIIKAEDDDIESEQSDCDIPAVKSEQSDCNGFQELFIENESLSKKKMFQCEFCSYQTKWKHFLIRHLLNHKNPSQTKLFKCEFCSYQTKWKSCHTRHLLTHPSQIKTFKCEFCSYQAKRKDDLANHSLIHKNPRNTKMFKCDMCPYETKRKCRFEEHLWKWHLKILSLTHKNPSERKMFKCKLCSFEAKWESGLKSHLLTHSSPSELEMFQCQFCSHQTKWKSSLTKHVLTHKSPSERIMFKCKLCSYEAKQKRSLKKHLLTHSSPS